jgi:hypothetical protein
MAFVVFVAYRRGRVTQQGQAAVPIFTNDHYGHLFYPARAIRIQHIIGFMLKNCQIHRYR